MGKIDTEAKAYLSNDERFSDLFNFWIYNGKNVIQPNELQELDTTAIAMPYGNKYKKHIQKYRDILKLYAAKHDKQAIYLILGLEVETKVHYAMAVHAMLYDALNYAGQVQAITDQRREDKPKETRDEFLSGLGKDDRLKPVITVVLNISGKTWDGATSIHELLSTKDNHILQFVPDYKLNLLSPNLLTDKDFDKFHTNLGVAMQFLKHQHDDNMNWLQNRKQLVDRATAEFIRTATGTMFEIDKEEGVIDMCRAWDNSLKQAKAEAQNSERLNSIRNVMKSLDVTVNRAMEILCIPAEEQEKYISMIQPSH